MTLRIGHKPKAPSISGVRKTGEGDGSSFMDGQADIWLTVGKKWRLQLGLLALAVCEQAAYRVTKRGAALSQSEQARLTVYLLSQHLGFSAHDVARLTGRAKAGVQAAVNQMEDWASDGLLDGAAMGRVEADLARLREAFDQLRNGDWA
jgi:hypothetical protein